MLRHLIVVVAVVLATATTATATPQANWPEPKLDAVASQIAGKPVAVWCEDNWGDWIHAGDSISEDWSYVNGFTFIDRPTVYLAPSVCETLHALVRLPGTGDVGLYHAALAIHVLVHEAVHQRGIANEGETDCTALALLRDVAVQHFGFTATERQAYTVTTTRRVKVGKRKFATVRNTAVRYREVESPRLVRLVEFGKAWHEAAPAEYQGTC